MSTNEIETKCRELRQLQNLVAEAEQEVEAIKDALKAHMGDSEELYAGEYMVTWRPVKSSRLDTAALRKALPDVSHSTTGRGRFGGSFFMCGTFRQFGGAATPLFFAQCPLKPR